MFQRRIKDSARVSDVHGIHRNDAGRFWSLIKDGHDITREIRDYGRNP